MTVLTDLLTARIANTGPISLADYMAEALLHPQHGYYTTRDPLGTDGDFTTAPEISQMFGELIGLCLAQTWMDQGSPNRFALVEAGPGRGTLMADILRATRNVPNFHAAARVYLIEASPALRQEQAMRIKGATWIDRISDLPEMPVLFVANEFLDALPVRQFVRDPNGWRERMVGLTEDALAFGLSSPAPITALEHRLEDTRDGDLVETCPALAGFVGDLGQRINAHGGAALFIDYGDWRSLGDTLQALRGHQPVDPLDAPGTADLTTHVDFEAVSLAAAPARFTRLTTQGVFLERLGITQRAQALAQALSGDPLQSHIAAHRRLTHPAEMGDLFKVMGIYPDTSTPPAGLEA